MLEFGPRIIGRIEWFEPATGDDFVARFSPESESVEAYISTKAAVEGHLKNVYNVSGMAVVSMT